MRKVALAASAAVLVLGAVLVFVPFFDRQRPFPASIPSPSPLLKVALLPIAPGQTACMPLVTMERHSQIVQLRLSSGGRSGGPLALSLRGPGVSELVPIAGGYSEGATLEVPVRAPARSTEVTACVANRGRHQVSLYGTADRTRSRSVALIGSQSTGISPQLAFYERRPTSIADRLGVTLQRMSAFRPAFVGPWLLWPLALLVLMGVPLLVLRAIDRSLRE